MDMILKRGDPGTDYVYGELFVDGVFECYTLEDLPRLGMGQGKVYGKTAIPEGEYQVVMSFSNRFKKVLPQVLGVKGFEGIRIHPGNTALDTEGCILVGNTKGAVSRGFIGESRAAFGGLIVLLQNAVDQGEKITLVVESPFKGEV